MSKTQSLVSTNLPNALQPTALALPERLSYDDWYAYGRDILAPIGRGVNWWIGDWLAYGEHKYGEKYAQGATLWPEYETRTLQQLCWVAASVHSSVRTENLSWSHHQYVSHLEPKEQKEWLSAAEREGWAAHEMRLRIKETKVLPPVPPAVGLFRTVVIDPPWPMEKIEREVRPNQAAPLDYRTMELEEIKAGTWYNPDGRLPFEPSGCHVYLWVTQKYLPAGLECFEAWGVQYQCALTWVKNIGFTPFSWMYSTEHVLFGHVGSLPLIEKGLRLDFTGKVREHSRKPAEFYALVERASPGPRIDLFAREPREGFESWGNEVTRLVA